MYLIYTEPEWLFVLHSWKIEQTRWSCPLLELLGYNAITSNIRPNDTQKSLINAVRVNECELFCLFPSPHPQNPPLFSPLSPFVHSCLLFLFLLLFSLSHSQIMLLALHLAALCLSLLVDTTVLILKHCQQIQEPPIDKRQSLLFASSPLSSPFCFPLSLTILYSGLYCLLLTASFSLPLFFFSCLYACQLLSIFNCFQLGLNKLRLTVASILSIIKTLTFIYQNLTRV